MFDEYDIKCFPFQCRIPYISHSYLPYVGLKTEWRKYRELEVRPLAGDKIQFEKSRGAYKHLGIADGKGGIYHYATEPGTGGGLNMKTSGHWRYDDDITTIAKGYPVRINNSEDKNQTKLVSEDIIQRCEDYLDEGEGEYNLVTNNCEHWANHMRYGKQSSAQVKRAEKIGLAAVLMGAAVGVGASYLANKK